MTPIETLQIIGFCMMVAFAIWLGDLIFKAIVKRVKWLQVKDEYSESMNELKIPERE